MAAASAAEAAESSRSGPSAAESYIGSLISLTSKSEIRYEGVLYNIYTNDSAIGLKNVRSFGTEGRKKDGPQIPASEKVYEYILFRGSDIKDLQVKSSPPVQNAPMHNDPAIIQSHYARLPPSSTTFPSVGSGIVPDLSSPTPNVGPLRPSFQGNMPLYQPGTANGSGFAVPSPMPMYWQGYYAPTGTLSHIQQPPLMRPPQGLSIPQSVQQPLPSASRNSQEHHSPLFPNLSSTLGTTSVAPIPSSLASLQVSSSTLEAILNPVQTKPNTGTSLPAPPLGNNLSFMPQLASSLEPVASLPQNLPPNVSGNSSLLSVSNVTYHTMPLAQPVPSSIHTSTLPLAQPVASNIDTSTSSQVETSSTAVSAWPPLTSNPEHVASLFQNVPIRAGSNPRVVPVSSSVGPSNSGQVETPLPPVTYQKVSQPAPPVASSGQRLQTISKHVEVKSQEAKNKPLLSEPSLMGPTEAKEPILRLPTPSRPKPNGAVFHNHQMSRGRGRGRGNGYAHPTTKFTEDFDFTAMNEKFNKDEVWGHLGKNKAQSGDNDGDIEEADEIQYEEGDEPSNLDSKLIYVKDDFFDSISCDALDRGQRKGRTRYSEQMKIDTETFGDILRNHPFRGGGRGFRGGRTGGSYYGRGYGYGRRGRAQSGPYHPF